MALIDDLINDVPAVFPVLRYVETIARAAGAPHHLLIETGNPRQRVIDRHPRC
jgi:hypothetical protein